MLISFQFMKFSLYYINISAQCSNIIHRTMDNTIKIQVSQLLERLNHAEKRATALQMEMRDIKSEISNLTDCARLVLNNSTASFSKVLSKNSSLSKRQSTDTTDSDLFELHQDKHPKLDIPMENEYVVVYTDGACENNGKANAKAGIGVWFCDGHSLNVSEPVKGRATNNTAEIQASAAALKIINKLGYKKAKVYTDSQFMINCITKWIKKWKTNGWKLSTGGAVKNKEDLVVLDNLCQCFDHIKWEYCAGHAGIKGNEAADELARRGATRYRPS